MKTYTLEVVINEGNDEFWEYVRTLGISGYEEVEYAIKQALAHSGFFEPECYVKVVNVKDKEE